MFHVYNYEIGVLVLQENAPPVKIEPFSFDSLFQAADPEALLARAVTDLGEPATEDEARNIDQMWLPPVESQEVWAAGVTYYRSRTARMEESEQAGGDRFYDLVYEAERPELFFKATAKRARGHLHQVGIREDSTWDVPEPELALAINSAGKVFGFTIGNDMSSRSIKGENPLYLPQAKVYRASCALGPCLVVGASAIPKDETTGIQITIERADELVFEGATDLSQLKRGYDELAAFLFRDNEFEDGALLMTGTGIVPGTDFTLASGDRIAITIAGIGTLENTVS